MTFQDFQKTIIERCHKAGACAPEFRRLKTAADNADKPGFIRVLLDNHWWCIDSGIYDALFFLELDEQDILRETGLPTQLNRPVDFRPERIGGKLWKPFNEGATPENGIGEYMTFEEANDPKSGRIVPTADDFTALCELPSEWALYQGEFGRLFDGRLFIPAAGNRSAVNGTLYNVGGSGYSWSSSVTTGSLACFLHFDSGGLNPQNSKYRRTAFRCVASKNNNHQKRIEMKTLNQIRDEVHRNAVEKGFYDYELRNTFPAVLENAFMAQKIALIHSELSEALEADRECVHADLSAFDSAEWNEDDFRRYVKDTFEDELADTIIRVLDLCGWLSIDIERHVELKMKYNELRPYKHGGKQF